ncbi:MAG: hypothetical protein GY873_16070 [Bosea sp.]|nr:hypothetical protein [Bosea sp. (in: a-proteobacteria)]
MLATATAQAEVAEHYRDADGALGIAQGPAAVAIRTALTARTRNCTGMDFKPIRCALADNAINADVHYSSADADSRKLAFVSVRWQSDQTGNAVEAKGLVFVAEPGVPFRLLGETNLIGESVREVIFERQRITYATGYLRGGDSRSETTGRRRYEVPLNADGIGPVAIQRTGFGATVTAKPSTQPDEALQLVKRLYEAGEDYAGLFGAASAKNGLFSPGLALAIREATQLSRRCPIYDGDPRLGGAQGAGGPIRMRYDQPNRQDGADHRTVTVTAAQAEAPDAISRTRVTLIKTAVGWRIDDLATEGAHAYGTALSSGIARCRSRAR